MLRFFPMLLLAAASLPAVAYEDVVCGGSMGSKVGGNIGVPTDYATQTSVYGVTQSPPTELLRVQIAWLPEDAAQRYRYQELIDINWKTQTHTEVDLYDNEADNVSTKALRPAEFYLNDSNFDSGHLDMIFCMPDNGFRGLVFAYYGTEGKIEHTYVAPFRVTEKADGGRWFSAVIDASTSNLINQSFNDSIVYDVTEDVEQSTGVLPPRYLAETLIQENLQSTTDLVARDHVMAFAPQNAAVVGNQLVVTDDNASVSLVHGTTKVSSNGQEIPMDNFRISHLENYLGPIAIEIHGTRSTAYIIDRRGDIQASATQCVDGMSTIRAEMKYESLALATMVLTSYNGDDVQELFRGPSPMVINVSCEAEYFLHPLTGGRDSKDAYFRFDDPAAYEIVLLYWYLGDPFVVGFPTGTDITPEMVRKIWGIEDLNQLWGMTRFGCSTPGGATVDSIDEIISTARATLSQHELEIMGLGDDATIADLKLIDTDGDGSVCNRGEMDPTQPYYDHYLGEISLRVRPNLAHPDFLISN